MSKNLIETIIGGIVLLIAVYFVLFVYNQTNPNAVKGYNIIAKFDRADGITVGSDVRMSGIKIGTVSSQELDEDTYLAVIKLSIEDKIKIPKDTSAEIIGGSLIGNKYISLVPGGEEETMQNGDEVLYTQSSISFESLISKFVFGSGNDKEKSDTNNKDKDKDKEDIEMNNNSTIDVDKEQESIS